MLRCLKVIENRTMGFDNLMLMRTMYEVVTRQSRQSIIINSLKIPVLMPEFPY